MFKNTNEFKSWLQAQAEPGLVQQINSWSNDICTQLVSVYRQFGQPADPGDMMQLSQAIGTAIPRFLKVAQLMGYPMDGPKAKQFVIDHSITLFRFIDRGSSGTEKKVIFPAGMDMSSVIPGGLEQGFVKAVAIQGVDESVKMLKRLGKL